MENSLKILLICDFKPNFEVLGYDSCSVLYHHFFNWLVKPLKDAGKSVDIKTIVSEVTYVRNKKSKVIDELNLIPISEEENRQIYGEILSANDKCGYNYFKNLPDNVIDKIKNLIYGKLNNFIPHIVIVYGLNKEIYEKIFPDSLVLIYENAIFSRPPFPRTLYFDPFLHIETFMHKFCDKISSLKLSNYENACIENLKKSVVELIDENNPIKKDIIKLKKKYKYLVLLPLCSLGSNLENETIFCSDYDYLSYVMERIPQNIGVIVTQHDYEKGLLNPYMLEYFRAKYNNLIFFDKVNNLEYGSSSLNFFKYVDVIINNHSMTGVQSLLWDKKIITTCRDYNDWYADKKGVENIEEFLMQPCRDKNNIIYWYITHYCLFLRRFTDGNWMYNYLVDKLEKFRKDGITFDYYNKIEDIDELSEYIIDYVKNYYNSKKMNHSDFKLKPLERIFSIKNHNNHKVITVAGVKTKIKRKKV